MPSFLRRLLARLLPVPASALAPAAAPALLPALAPRAPLSVGVNLIGYARGGLGLGENLRRCAEALDAAGERFALIDLAEGLGQRGVDPRVDRWIVQANPHPTNVFFVNADQMPVAKAHFGDAFFAGRRNIGFWFWELERFPAAWAGALDLVDEVWTASEFVRSAIRACTDKPVRRIALPVQAATDRRWTRAEFGLPDAPFSFFFNFDFHSFAQRKNPMAAIAAFRAAFAQGDSRAMLLIKSINGDKAPAQRAALDAAIAGDPRILVRDEFLDHARAIGLMSVCDAYVSLHRSEGFGLGLAEAMCLGKPTVATSYSGNLDFMTPDNSCLVRHRLVEVGADEYPWGAGQHWAEADIDDAARWMRRLVDDPALARTIGEAGRESIARTHGREAFVASVRRALAD